MRSILLPVLALAALSCTSTSPRNEVEPPFAPAGTAKRVVLMSFDGLGGDALATQTGLPTFERLAREGTSARIVNVDRAIDAETLVLAARRQGKRVGAVPDLMIDDAASAGSADFGLVATTPLVPARLLRLTRASFKREWVPPSWTPRPPRRTSWSPVMRSRIEWSVPGVVRADVDIVAYDTTNDGRENYDALHVEIDGRELATDERGWFAVSAAARGRLYGSWSKVTSTNGMLDVTLYWGPICTTTAYPDSFRAAVENEAGFWPGMPEEQLQVDRATYLEQLERLTTFHRRAQTLAIRTMPFDLLLLDYPLLATWTAADGALAEVAEALGEGDALLVTGRQRQREDLSTPFFAYGAGIPAVFPREVQQTQVAAFVMRLMGIEPTAQVREAASKTASPRR